MPLLYKLPLSMASDSWPGLLNLILVANTTTLTLHCLVIGQPISDAFTVNIARNGTVSTLKGVIKGSMKNKSIFEHIPAHRLVLWSVSLPADESLNNAFEGLREENALVSPFLKLSTIFSSPIEDHVHVAVAPPLGKQSTPSFLQ